MSCCKLSAKSACFSLPDEKLQVKDVLLQKHSPCGTDVIQSWLDNNIQDTIIRREHELWLGKRWEKDRLAWAPVSQSIYSFKNTDKNPYSVFPQGGRTPVKPDCPVETQKRKVQSSGPRVPPVFKAVKHKLLEFNGLFVFCLFSSFSIVALTITAMGNTCSLCFHPRYHKNIMVTYAELFAPWKLEKSCRCIARICLLSKQQNVVHSHLLSKKIYNIFFSTAK